MVDTNLKVKVEADTDEAVEAIQEVTEAVEELENALERLNKSSTNLSINWSAVNNSSNTNTELGDV